MGLEVVLPSRGWGLNLFAMSRDTIIGMNMPNITRYILRRRVDLAADAECLLFERQDVIREAEILPS